MRQLPTVVHRSGNEAFSWTWWLHAQWKRLQFKLANVCCVCVSTLALHRFVYVYVCMCMYVYVCVYVYFMQETVHGGCEKWRMAEGCNWLDPNSRSLLMTAHSFAFSCCVSSLFTQRWRLFQLYTKASSCLFAIKWPSRLFTPFWKSLKATTKRPRQKPVDRVTSINASCPYQWLTVVRRRKSWCGSDGAWWTPWWPSDAKVFPGSIFQGLHRVEPIALAAAWPKAWWW